MEQLKKKVEAVIREVHGLDEGFIISDIEVTFVVKTEATNGTIAGGKVTFPQVTNKRTYKPRKKVRKKARMSMHREFTTSPDDLAVMRNFLSRWRKDNLLTGEQEHFLAQTQGVFARSLSQETKSKLREHFEDVRRKVLNNRLEKRESASE